ncbi:hypothetical protein C1645_826500 [Glomus cerebriforme]|uniref:Cytochrome P450 n=1 Tax=Glomus cerebriforme TaxID=658196 RepID=A0A397SZK7_9GLOM|nr:hypothetical protein C1645_826500 [Glomus cerebriforme]
MIKREYYTFKQIDVPKDRFVYIRLQEVHRDEELSNLTLSNHIESPAIRVKKNFLAFGFRKHACPGRYFEIKTTLHHFDCELFIIKI